MDRFSFQNGGTEFEFSKNPWDSSAFGRNCHDLTIRLGRTLPSRESVFRADFVSELQTITCRVPPGDDGLRNYLYALGFRQVELQLTCRLVLSTSSAPSQQLGTLRLAGDNDHREVEKIASEIFLDSRFRHIPHLPVERIGRRFSSWTRQLYEESPEFAHVLVKDGDTIGFFYSKPSGRPNELYAALGGVSNECKGPQGFYLYPAVMHAYRNSGIKSVVSAISADNIGALNLWAGLGTRFPQAIDIFMWNAEQSRV